MSDDPTELPADYMKHYEDIRQYCEALGFFVTQFASAEATLQLVLWKCANVPDETARAIFSGVKIDAATGLIKRIAAAHEWPKADIDLIEYVFAQLGEINSLRNDILHFGAVFHDDGNHVTTNALLAHTENNLRERPVSVEILKQMGQDLLKIQAHLLFRFIDGSQKEKLTEVLEASWRYKPPSPKTPRRRSREQDRRQQGRRRSSQG